MNKKAVHHFWRFSKYVPATFLILLFLVSSASAVLSLRSNNLKMIELRNNVAEADKQNIGIEKSLDELKNFVTSHMNTSLRSGSFSITSELPVQLSESYSRAKAATATQATAEREKIAKDAETSCEEQFRTAPLTRRAQCVQEYTAARPVTEKTINKDFFTYDFASPTWSPDLAGWSIVAAVLSAVLLILRLIVSVVVKSYLREQV